MIQSKEYTVARWKFKVTFEDRFYVTLESTANSYEKAIERLKLRLARRNKQ